MMGREKVAAAASEQRTVPVTRGSEIYLRQKINKKIGNKMIIIIIEKRSLSAFLISQAAQFWSLSISFRWF